MKTAKIDYEAKEYSLHYLRTKEGQEVDFALVFNGDVEVMVEAKNRDPTLSKALLAYHRRYGYPAVQVVRDLKREIEKDGIQVPSGETFLTGLVL